MLHVVVLAVLAAGWLGRVVATYNDPELGGLFRFIGVDFGFYLAHAQVFATGNIAGLYSLDTAVPFREALQAYAAQPDLPLPAGPVPYPPVYAWLTSPLAGFAPPAAFAIWTGLNAIATGVVAWRVASLVAPERRLLAAGLFLLSSAAVFSLFFGNVQMLLTLAFAEAFVAFRRGRDQVAGAWLAILVLKPQYLLIVLPVLAWKRRWRTLAGFAAGGLVVGLLSLVVAGPEGISAYVASLLESLGASGGAVFTAVAPDVMVNWRSLVLAIPGGFSDSIRLGLTIALSAATVLAVLVAFRGPWQANGARFAGQMTLLAIGTVLAAYHSHVHGVAMVAVPLVAFLASDWARRPVARAIAFAVGLTAAAGILAPWLWFAVLNGSHARANQMVGVTLVVGFLLVLVALLRDGGTGAPPDAREAQPA